MRILITGATGFIGRHLAEHFAGRHELFLLQRQPPRGGQDGAHVIQQDLTRPLELGRFPHALDAIIHQAAVIFTEACASDDIPFLVNVVATWRLVEYAAAAGAHTFVHASTGGIYGCRDRPFVEDDAPNPMDLYSLTKAQAELAVRAGPPGMRKIILRYFFPYAPGTPNRIPHFVQRAVAGEPLQLLEGGGPRLNPLHISDAVEATERALALEADDVLNIAGTEVTTFGELATIAARRAGREVRAELIPRAEAIPYYRSDLVASIARMQARLGFTPRVSLEDGIAELADSYLHPSA